MADKDATTVLPADAEGIARAASILRGGGLVALPTETVYGLAARADDAGAVAGIYAAKGRPGFNPLIVHVRSLEHARDYAGFSDAATALAQAHWPGPLTLVLPLNADAGLAPAVTAGLDTVAIRVPAHPAMQVVLERVGAPLAAPSANRSGFVSPTTAAHVLASLDGRIDAVLDDGPTRAGLESTIIGFDENGAPRELRPGPVALDTAAPFRSEKVTAPGQLASHYSPGKPVRLEAERAGRDEFLIGFGAMACDCNLSPGADLREAAARLYACLHAAADAAQPRVAVAAIPAVGEGRAINDRLRRAAAPRD